MASYRIAIAGAGTTGLAAAAFLARDGHDVRIFERFEAARPLGAGVLLQPTGLACLARLGLDDEAIAHGARISAIEGKTTQGRTVLDLAYSGLAPECFGVGIHRSTLFDILYGAAVRLGVSITTGTSISGSRLEADGRYLMSAAKGAHGPFDLVIDATGLRSPLRLEAHPAAREHMFTWGALWSAVPLPADWTGASMLRQRYQGASTMIGVLPIGRRTGQSESLAAFFWSIRIDRYAAWRVAGIDAWRRQVVSLWPDVEPLISGFREPEDLTFASYSDLTLRTPIAERLAVIGDAAHCTSPQLGQGANLGLADALTLATCLKRSSTLPGALAGYAAERRRHVRFYQFASRWLTPFFQSDSRGSAAVRDLTFGLLCRAPIINREMLSTLAGIKTGVFTRLDPGAWHADYTLARTQASQAMAGRGTT